jgi:hypothetical protein
MHTKFLRRKVIYESKTFKTIARRVSYERAIAYNIIVSTIYFVNNGFTTIKDNPTITLLFIIPGGILLIDQLYKLIKKK